MAIITINNASEFEKEVLAYKGMVLVDFWATWCGPCKLVAPEVEKVATQLDGKIKVARLDVNAVEDVAATYGIQGVPTLALFNEGKEVDRMVGFRPASAIIDFINQ